jgi:chaperone required for assembly of F1-ATPase
MKRLYRQVEVAGEGDRHHVLLDGRPVCTPAKRVLTLSTSALAAVIAAEWRDQGDIIQAATMPLTRLASTAQERLPGLRAAAIKELIGYADTDLLCYRAAAPLDLVERQGETWQPLLDWGATTHGARLVVTTSILPVSQPQTAVSRLQAAVEALDDWPLVGLHAATTALGSVVLGLALVDGRIDAGQALGASLLDELFEIERWGQDAETERRHAALRRDVEAAATFLAALASGRA